MKSMLYKFGRWLAGDRTIKRGEMWVIDTPQSFRCIQHIRDGYSCVFYRHDGSTVTIENGGSVDIRANIHTDVMDFKDCSQTWVDAFVASRHSIPVPETKPEGVTLQ